MIYFHFNITNFSYQYKEPDVQLDLPRVASLIVKLKFYLTLPYGQTTNFKKEDRHFFTNLSFFSLISNYQRFTFLQLETNSDCTVLVTSRYTQKNYNESRIIAKVSHVEVLLNLNNSL